MIQLRPYQLEVIEKLNLLFKTEKEAVIASAPNSGKTVIATEYIKQQSNSNFLILTHGTNVLKAQWNGALKASGLDYSDQLGKSRVAFGIPQSIYRKEGHKVDFLIIDEAHEFSFAEMVTLIKEKFQPSKIIYLTGTPSKFIAKGYNPIIVPAIELIKQGYSSDLYVGMVSTSAAIDDDDFNGSGDLKESKAKKLEKTVRADLDSLLTAIHKRLSETGMFKDKPELRKLVQWAPTLGKLDKTMIACRSIKQADEVQKYFESKNIKAVVSHSQNDADSQYIEDFKNQKDIKVLIVVDRGILGFDMAELVNVVDLTCSRNIDRIYQLYARVMRKSEKHTRKYFFKFSTEESMLLNKFYMNAALQLMFEEFISLYNGKNLNGMRIPEFKAKGERKEKQEGKEKSEKPKKIAIDSVFMKTIQAGTFLIDIKNQLGVESNEYAYITFGEIKNKYLGNAPPRNYWTLEKCKEDALKYKGRQEWIIKSFRAYNAARRHGWLDICCSHMGAPLNELKWTLETCKENAKIFKTKKQWELGEPSAYQAACRNKWLDTCCSHMNSRIYKPRIKWTKELCIEDAKKYPTQKHWTEKSSAAYVKARREGWLEECIGHMTSFYEYNKKLNIDKIKNEANKYDNMYEWEKNDFISFNEAKNIDILLFNTHMISDIEFIQRSANKYKSKKDWKESEPEIYKLALKKGLKQFINHMELTSRPSNKKQWVLNLNTNKIYRTVKDASAMCEIPKAVINRAIYSGNPTKDGIFWVRCDENGNPIKGKKK